MAKNVRRMEDKISDSRFEIFSMDLSRFFEAAGEAGGCSGRHSPKLNDVQAVHSSRVCHPGSGIDG